MPSWERQSERLPAHLWKVASVAILGSLLAQIDSTVVNVSLSTLAVDLHSTLETIQWVTSGYLLALALLMPLNGWLVDRVGTRKLYLWCFSGFTLTSALCGAAWSAQSLIGFRILQGMAGGLLAPMAQLIMAQAAGRHMTKVFGYVAMPVLLGPILGPVIAGTILTHLTWRWLFLVNLPVGTLGLVLAVLFLPNDEGRPERRAFDLQGFLLLSPALVLFLYGTDHIRNRAGRVCFALGLLMVGVFARTALRKGRQALLDMELFRKGVFPVSAQTQFLQNGIVFATQMLLPLYLIRSCARTPAAVGLLLLPLGLGMMVVYPSLGWLTNRFGIRNVAAGGSLTSLFTAIALASLARHNVVGPLFATVLLVRGIGQGAIGVPSISAAYNGVPKSELPMATTTLNIVQRLGGPTVTTLMATFLAWRMRLGQSPEAISNSFVQAFVLVSILHALLLISTVHLPKVLAKAVGESAAAR
ncbi:MAG TPA: DHA2 family efflux MFS transporter permease subunit [Edaphobacter sp.]|nr:DHA2 family efflux MFS transporter permease subunit [Edaphobacter sp.]